MEPKAAKELELNGTKIEKITSRYLRNKASKGLIKAVYLRGWYAIMEGDTVIAKRLSDMVDAESTLAEIHT